MKQHNEQQDETALKTSMIWLKSQGEWRQQRTKCIISIRLHVNNGIIRSSSAKRPNSNWVLVIRARKDLLRCTGEEKSGEKESELRKGTFGVSAATV